MASLFLLPSASAELRARAIAPRDALVQAIRDHTSTFPQLDRDEHFVAALEAIRSLRREAFVPDSEAASAYQDAPLPIGDGQTISAPSVVALMTAAARIEPGSRVLEVGTGSGFQAAVLAHLGARVFSVEIVERLALDAAERLRRLGFPSVEVRGGDGFEGWPEKGPFDAVIVTAGATKVPPALLDQLRVGGRLIMPIGPVDLFEQIIVFEKTKTGIVSRCSLGRFSFVPLTGRGREPVSRSGELDFTTPYCFGRLREVVP